ncbi:GNAT family N-acetyltransferase [Actinomyces sp. HMSC065F11]|uniref:GNAT family N-acetyltransferase n=1 Tax=Actinomyces sp. HMSC065F11 TaxID=1739395 RepID=UPI0009F2EBDF|nr:GNAT family N-acetyltransferase [Actinomyces sp. HMSC065F11]
MSLEPAPVVLTAANLEQVLHFEQQVFPKADQWSRASWTAELSSPDRIHFGMFDRDVLIAAAGASINEVADVLTIGVLPEYQGRGIAGALLDHLLQVLRIARFFTPSQVHYLMPLEGDRTMADPASGDTSSEDVSESVAGIERSQRRVSRVMLEVRASNASAIGLYGSRGFKQIARIPRYYRAPSEEAVVMELGL